jgi:fructokinase
MRMGIDIGGTKIEGVIIDEAGEVRARRRIATPAVYEEVLRALGELVGGLENEGGWVRSIGIGAPGALRDGVMQNAHHMALQGKPFLSDIERALGRPVRLANDAHCFALSEAVDGAAAGARVVFGVVVGTGVGGALVTGGQLHVGPNGLCGEWGHNPLPWARPEELPGPLCACGRRGCIESWLSGGALSRDHELTTGERQTGEQILARAVAGNRGCRTTLGRYADRMARALATIINMIDPDVIVVGGGLSQIAALYRLVPMLWKEHVLSPATTRLVAGQHGDAGAVRGAAWLWPKRPLTVGRA